ncbi:CatB-related O-acetyltransferase [Flavobacterium sp.]|uniref:CatB-related O-acetyltransferase n=1 Tax=Flavobacterium sp. TaxID=239 RepID=UPI0039E25CD2
MVQFFRNLLWKFLGIKYYRYLKGRNATWLKDAAWAKVGTKTYDNGAFVWRWYQGSALEIGNYCSIAANVNFVCDSGYHTQGNVTSFPLFHELAGANDSVHIDGKDYRVGEITQKLRPQKSGISIGHDVWIGTNATILPGVKIGNGVTILAGAVVSKDLPDYAVAGGVPAKIIEMKHDPEIIEAMNRVAWWHWPESKIKAHLDDFYLPIETFIQKHQ